MKNTRFVSIASLALSATLMFSVPAFASQTLNGDANVDQRNYPSTMPFVHPPFYNVMVTVEVDDNGVITSVSDNGTGGEGSVQEGNEEFWANKNKPYFDTTIEAGALDLFVGKTVDEVKSMDMSGVDAVAGATQVGAALQEAVVNAVEGKQGKTFLPVEGNAMPVESIENNVITMSSELPEDFDLELLDIRYGVYNAEDQIVPADSYTFEAKDGKVTITFKDITTLKPGKYYVNVVDASEKYRSPDFEAGHGEESAAQAPYFIIESGLEEGDVSFDGKAIVLKEGDIKDYLANVEHVIIKAEGSEEATEQEPVGHHGTPSTNYIVLGENGELNVDGILKARDGSETPLFAEGTNYTVTVDAFGYPELTFDFAK